ncbi:prepilin-type N-terminal cleavage/methylation domain-containing protein [Candidatus Saccharibacteria bacterium]|nr:prepilin-type N-terminal cleavage/methylation domain-containing protein [Candidatus Saccharibacteria bacterium]
MKKIRRGFTLVEVMLFLAVTGLLFLGVTMGVQNSIYQQRYNDAVQSFADFLRNIYAEVANVQHPGNGRSNEAVYGKLVTFDGNDEKQVIYTYDVVGNATSPSMLDNGEIEGLLSKVQANVLRKEGGDEGSYQLAGIVETYSPKWGSRIQPKGSFTNYKGALLIVRSPKSGVIQTLATADGVEPLDVQSYVESDDAARVLLDYLVERNGSTVSSKFAKSQVDFCINPDGNTENTNRTDVRLLSGAYNGSGVEIVARDEIREDGTGNLCNGGNP